MLSFPRKREPITTVSGIWVPAFARTTDQIATADSRSAVVTLLRNDVDDDPVGGVYDQQHLAEHRVLVRSYRRYLPGDGCRQRVQRDRPQLSSRRASCCWRCALCAATAVAPGRRSIRNHRTPPKTGPSRQPMRWRCCKAVMLLRSRSDGKVALYPPAACAPAGLTKKAPPALH